ncbi:hypothetical protein EDB84DRAFT_1569679 [Lactarius hengduanensis]|nr:hypothetical protein EDB84DRAFT_1569679 [Lactarius hengduanensis]
MSDTDDDQNAQKDPSRTIKIPVQITTNATGEPEIPSIVKGDGHQTKVVQTALRGYCTAHIRFISGKPYATIPWAKLSTTPTAWIQEECYPPGFKWADPSKIRLNDVHDLLIYWRQRKEDGLDPLIWNPSCELLADSDLEKTSKHLPARRRHQNASTSDVDVQRGPAGSDTEGLEQAGIGFAQSLEHPSVPHHSSSFNVERSDNMQPSEPTPTELTHNPDGLTTNLSKWEDAGWIGIENAALFKKAAYILKRRTATTSFQWVKGHDGILGNEESDKLAEEGAEKDTPDDLPLDILVEFDLQGAKLASLSQASAYKGIRALRPPHPRTTTMRNIELAKTAVLRFNKIPETTGTIWKNSLQAGQLLGKRAKQRTQEMVC